MTAYAQGFRTQDTELEVPHAPVRGSVPEWLAGSLVRVTPAQFEVGGRPYRHWFDGLAMLHRFSFDRGRVSYRNRYLRSPAYVGNNESGTIAYAEFATEPCTGIFGRVASFFTPPKLGANANVTVTRLADDYVARTEYPASILFDPESLDTLGVYEHPGTQGQLTTAHPHHDTSRRTDYNVQLRLGRRPAWLFYAMPDGRDPQVLARIDTEQPSYLHSFGMSDRYLLLTEFPLKLKSALSFLLGNDPFIENYRWMPEHGTRVTVIDKEDGEVVARHEVEPCFAFHHVNAFERDGEVVMDVATYDDASIINQFYLDNLRGDEGSIPAQSTSKLRRYRIPLDARSSVQPHHEVVSDTTFELPRFDYASSAGRDYRYVYGASVRDGVQDFMNQIVKLDVVHGDAVTWAEDGSYPGEPIFVRAPGARAEDAGVVLSVVLDTARQTSFLLVLDATTLDERARVELPQHIPFGFHGEYFPEDSHHAA